MELWVKERRLYMTKYSNNGVNFAWPVTSINNYDYLAFCEWYDNNKIDKFDKLIIIYGAGVRGSEFYLFCKEKKILNIAYTDSNSEKWGGFIEDKKIFPIDVAIEKVKNKEAIFVISVENYKEISANLKKLGFEENRNLFWIDARMYERYKHEFLRQFNNKYLLMGDCEFTTVSIRDIDKRNLGDMIKDELGEDNIKVLAMHGMGLRSHYNVLKKHVALYDSPEMLVLMINFDTLNGIQHLLPRSQHEELLLEISKIEDEVDPEFEKYLSVVHERSKNLKAEFYTDIRNRNSHTKCRNYIRLNYLYKLDNETEGVIYLNKIFEFATSKKIKVIPFIPPVNFELGREIFNEQFDATYCENVKKIKTITRKHGADLLDLSYLLGKGFFAEANTPDETLNELGRKLIVEKLRERM